MQTELIANNNASDQNRANRGHAALGTLTLLKPNPLNFNQSQL